MVEASLIAAADQTETARSTGHTPGPWVFEPHGMWGGTLDGESFPFGYISTGHPTPIFVLDTVLVFPDEELFANARLIAAAPDLLTEAREICAILDNYRADTGEEPCFDHEAIGEEVARRHDQLTAAIAKAVQP